MERRIDFSREEYAKVMAHCTSLLRDEGYPVRYIVPVLYTKPQRGDQEAPGLYARIQMPRLYWDIPIEGKSPIGAAICILTAAESMRPIHETDVQL